MWGNWLFKNDSFFWVQDTRKQLEEQESHVENLKAQYDDLLKRSANSHFLSEEMVAVDTELQRYEEWREGTTQNLKP